MGHSIHLIQNNSSCTCISFKFLIWNSKYVRNITYLSNKSHNSDKITFRVPYTKYLDKFLVLKRFSQRTTYDKGLKWSPYMIIICLMYFYIFFVHTYKCISFSWSFFLFWPIAQISEIWHYKVNLYLQFLYKKDYFKQFFLSKYIEHNSLNKSNIFIEDLSIKDLVLTEKFCLFKAVLYQFPFEK